MHPHAQPQHHDAGKQRRRALQQLALRTADINHIGCQRPGAQPRHKRQAPADVNAAHRRLLIRVTQESKDRRQHQNRFQTFAQQNQQAGNVTQRPAQTLVAQQAGRCLQLVLGHVQALLDLAHRQAILQRLTVGHQGFFSVFTHVGVNVIQRALNQLEAFQIRCYR
ncbi:hypothetical protein D3C84_388640 [compost metagenome]